MTYAEHLKTGMILLGGAGIDTPELDAWYLMEYICKIDKNFYYLHMQEDMDEIQSREYASVLQKRAERIPLQYITGEQEFMGLTFKVNENVLIPRQDTETLVEICEKILQERLDEGINPWVLDMCTGSGCIAISLKKRLSNLLVSASDSSKQALTVAKENGRLLDAHVEWIYSDLFANITGQFDMIVSNPPYIPSDVIGTLMPEVRLFEPVSALDGAGDGLAFYREITNQAHAFLREGGWLCFEIGCEQGEAVKKMMLEQGFSDVTVQKDLAGLDRVVTGHL